MGLKLSHVEVCRLFESWKIDILPTQAHQAHVHTVESKSVKKDNTVQKKPPNKAAKVKSTNSKAAPSPNPPQTKTPRSQTDNHQPPIRKKINASPAVKRTELQQGSDSMLYLAIAVLVIFLAFACKLFL